MKPMVNDVTGLSNAGVMSLADIFRGFMNNTSFLTQPVGMRLVTTSSSPTGQIVEIWIVWNLMMQM